MGNKLKITEKGTGIIVVQTDLDMIDEAAEAEFSEKWPRTDYLWEILTPTGTLIPTDVPVVESDMTDEERNAAAAANLDDVKELKSLQEIDLTQRFPVVEIFSSVQGEGALIGMPTTFIRLAGCDMACPWCDSKDTWKKPNIEEDFQTIVNSYIQDFEANGSDIDTAFLDSLDHDALDGPWAESALGRQWITIQDLVEKCDCGIVVITGGEPCIHENLQDLVLAIKYIKGRENVLVCIETNGAQATPAGIDWVVASPKSNNDYKIHPDCQWNELKYVVDETFDPSVVPESVLNGTVPAGCCWLQPCDIRYGMPKNERIVLRRQGEYVSVNKDEMTILEANEKSWKRCYELAMEYKCFRVGIQMHKFMGAR